MSHARNQPPWSGAQIHLDSRRRKHQVVASGGSGGEHLPPEAKAKTWPEFAGGGYPLPFQSGLSQVMNNGGPEPQLHQMEKHMRKLGVLLLCLLPLLLAVQSVVLHTVQKGDTLYSISKEHGVTVEQIRMLNDLPDNDIRVGQKLLIHGLRAGDEEDGLEITEYREEESFGPRRTVTPGQGNAIWKIEYHVPYGYELGETDFTAPVYINGKLVTDQIRNRLDYFTAEYLFEVREGDVVEYRIADPWEANLTFVLRDHHDRVLAQRNPCSSFAGTSPAPQVVRLNPGDLPGPAHYSLPVNGGTAHPVSGRLEWLQPTGKVNGYRVWWGKTGHLELVADQTQMFWAPPQPQEYNTGYEWRIVPYNEYGEATDCPVWRYRTALFTFAAATASLGGIADFDDDGTPDFLNVDLDQDSDDGLYPLTLFRGFSGIQTPLGMRSDGYPDSGPCWLDCDRDGNLDIVLLSFEDEEFSHRVFLNTGGKFSSQPLPRNLGPQLPQTETERRIRASEPSYAYFLDSSGEPAAWLVLDADGDGDTDLLPGPPAWKLDFMPKTAPNLPENYSPYPLEMENSALTVMLRDGSSFPPATNDLPSYDHSGLLGYYWCDFDLDGDADLLKTLETGNYGVGLAEIFRNDSGKLVPTGQALNGYQPGKPESAFWVGSYLDEVWWHDIDADGDPDLLARPYSEGPSNFRVYLNQTIHN